KLRVMNTEKRLRRRRFGRIGVHISSFRTSTAIGGQDVDLGAWWNKRPNTSTHRPILPLSAEGHPDSNLRVLQNPPGTRASLEKQIRGVQRTLNSPHCPAIRLHMRGPSYLSFLRHH